MFAILFSFGLLASAISTNKIILYALSPVFLTGIRMLLGGIILLIYILTQAHRHISWEKIKKYFWLLLIIMLFTTYANSILKAYALKHMPSAKATFFGTLDPFVAAFYSYIFFGEKLTYKKLMGIFLAIIGTIILLVSSSSLEEQLRAFSFISYPELAAIIALAMSRFGWTLAQSLLKQHIFTPAQLNTVLMLMAGILSLITAYAQHATCFFKNILAVIGPCEAFTITSLAQAPLAVLHKPPLSYLSPHTLLYIFLAYTIFVGNVIAYNLYAHMLKKHSATYVALMGFSIPLFVQFYGWLFLSEQLSRSFFLACSVTFAGLLIFFQDEHLACKKA